jgi:hypothetical protein
MAVLEAGRWEQEAEAASAIAHFVSLSTTSQPSPGPLTKPSPCLVAGEDDLTPKAEPVHMNWAEDAPDVLPPLPIDFDSKERGTSSSIHCADNAMTDDAPGAVDTPTAVATFQDMDTSALSLSPTSSPEPQSEVAQLFRLIMDTIEPIKVELKCIGDKVDGRSSSLTHPHAARLTPSKAQTTGAKGARAPTSSTPTQPLPPFPSSSTSVSPAQRVDDEEQEVIALISDDSDFPSLKQTTHSNRHRQGRNANKSAEIQAWNSLIPGAPAPVQRVQGTSRLRAPLIFASVLTAKGLGNHIVASKRANQARGIQKCTASGKLKPGHSTAPTGFTDVVVTCNGGADDSEAEEVFQRKNLVDIVQAAQRALNKSSQNPPLILRGRWSENVAKTGNFVYRLAGDIPLSNILACTDQLCKPFPEGGLWLVPTKGWTWVQLQGVDVSYLEDNVQFIYENSQLLEAFAANPCFQGADIMVPPHFQGNPSNFKFATATVIAAISDMDNSRCQCATSEGVCMFGRQVKFVHAGDNPLLVQCSRCHEIGHHFSSPKCRVKPDAHQCYPCGEVHHSDNHDFECSKPHVVQGVCNCILKCILCKGDGHDARSKKCPRRGDFIPL